MDNSSYCTESLNSALSGTKSGSSDDDMVEITGATLDFSVTEDVQSLDRDGRDADHGTGS